ncbi:MULTISPECIES: hypothetical protein [Bartonella]|uniref:hypothetical protein n=1 Tax=Bartonella TaxID=773 RepID=UPI003857E701
MPLMNRFKCQGLFPRSNIEAQICDSVSLLLYKRRDGGAQWIYRYIISWAPARNGLGSVERCLSKTKLMNEQQWHSVLREGCDSIKERDK